MALRLMAAGVKAMALGTAAAMARPAVATAENFMVVVSASLQL